LQNHGEKSCLDRSYVFHLQPNYNESALGIGFELSNLLTHTLNMRSFKTHIEIVFFINPYKYERKKPTNKTFYYVREINK